ncbi:hypothetical protein SVIOM74S_03657 [Streptomyces violarus]
MEILQLAAAGDDINEIAVKLSLSPGTVRNYLATTVRKMDARNRLKPATHRQYVRLDLTGYGGRPVGSGSGERCPPGAAVAIPGHCLGERVPEVPGVAGTRAAR